MDQQRTVNKILFELKQMDLIKIEGVDEIRVRLEWAYAAGFDSGTKQIAHQKPVNQYDMYGNFIRSFESISLAAHSVKRNKSAVMKSAQGKTNNCAGYVFRYADEDEKQKSKKLRIA